MGAGAHAPGRLMSKRSQLRFVQQVEQTGETDGETDRVAQVYRHSDGYPASVLWNPA
ncbi:MAG: hypothetical protein ACI9PP_000270 [Halobacteriales archaeon]|jgi:hypothetical protein